MIPSAELVFTLAGKPMGKQRVRVTRNGHAYTPERTVSYEGRLAHAAALAMKVQGLEPFAGPLKVRLAVQLEIPPSWPARKRALAAEQLVFPTGKPDADNYAKMLDALNLIVWVDDSQIVELTVTKSYATTPGMDIRVEQIINPFD